jgi:hypothetical protein
VGDFIIRCDTSMQNPTGGFTLIPPGAPPYDGAQAIVNGTVDMPITADPNIYLDAAIAPTAIADLPSGWTPDDAYTLHSLTSCTAAGDNVTYTLTALGVAPNIQHPAGTTPPFYTDTPLTGLTLAKITAFLGSTVTITGTVVLADVAVQNLVGGTWDPVFNISIVGTYTTAAPEVTSVTPSTGSINGGQAVTIRGTGFTAATGVLFGGIAATSVVIVDDETITAVTPAHLSGTVDVEVLSVATGADLYTYAVETRRVPPIPTRTTVAQGGARRRG